MAHPVQESFVFEKVRKTRARKPKPVPDMLTAAGPDEEWQRDPRSFFCETVVTFDAEVSGYRLPDPGGRPDALFTPRRLTEVAKLPGSYSLTGARPKIYLPVDKRREDEMLAAGAMKGPKGGFFLDMEGSGLDERLRRARAFTPFIAQPVIRPFQVEPIPSTSWGATLANLLTATAWERLRLRATHAHAHLCQICGEGNRKSTDVHELWTYDMPSEKKEWESGVQRLVGLLSLCKACHRMFHPGHAHIMGRGEEAIERLMLVNRWSRPETDAYLDWAGAVWARRSQVSWSLDLSFLDGEQLTVSSGGWTATSDGRLFPKKGDTERATRILGAAWTMTPVRGKAAP